MSSGPNEGAGGTGGGDGANQSSVPNRWDELLREEEDEVDDDDDADYQDQPGEDDEDDDDFFDAEDMAGVLAGKSNQYPLGS